MWTIEFHDEFEPEFDAFPEVVRDRIAAALVPLREDGPSLGRPRVDTLYDSRHANMKELRVQVGGEPWRVFFAFDPRRSAILLVGGCKAGANERRWYKEKIKVADTRFRGHLKKLEGEGGA